MVTDNVVIESTYIENSHRTINSPHVRDEDTDVLCKIHIRPLLSKDEALKCKVLALQYAQESKCWDGGKMDGTKHTSYNTVDFPLVEFDDNDYDNDSDRHARVADNPLAEYLESIDFSDRIFGKLEEAFGIPSEYLEYEDLFCVKYVAKEDDILGRGMESLDCHRDGTLLSFNVLLSEAESFSGGGTVFDCLRGCDVMINEDSYIMKDGSITPRNTGDCVLHSGKLLHGGQTVMSGSRIIVVGFVGIPEWLQQEGALSNACKRWGRLDVLQKRLKRQALKMGENIGYRINTKRWLPSSQAVYSGWYHFVQISSASFENYQKKIRIEAEGELLRGILLSSEERKELYLAFHNSEVEISELDKIIFEI